MGSKKRKKSSKKARGASSTDAPPPPQHPVLAINTNPGEVFDILMDHLIRLMNLSIGRRTNATNVARDRMVSVLNNFPVLCRATRDVVAADARYGPIMFYERVRLGASDSGFFLEAVPRSVELLDVPAENVYISQGPPNRAVGSGSSTRAVQGVESTPFSIIDAHQTASKNYATIPYRALCNNMPPPRTLVRAMEAKPSTDCVTISSIPNSVPRRVHSFVDETRFFAQRLRRQKPDACFCNCANEACGRLLYCGLQYRAQSSASVEETADAAFGEYWKTIAQGGGGASGMVRSEGCCETLVQHPAMFCTWMCYESYKRQLALLHSCVPTDGMNLAEDAKCRKEGRARVGEALRLAAKRNAQYGRLMREIVPDVRLPGLRTDLFFKTLTKKLNVDLALLYASSILAESPQLARGKVLAGAHAGWRRRPMFFAKPLRKLVVLYDRHHTGGHVISNLLIDENFLRKVRQVAIELF